MECAASKIQYIRLWEIFNDKITLHNYDNQIQRSLLTELIVIKQYGKLFGCSLPQNHTAEHGKKSRVFAVTLRVERFLCVSVTN